MLDCLLEAVQLLGGQVGNGHRYLYGTYARRRLVHPPFAVHLNVLRQVMSREEAPGVEADARRKAGHEQLRGRGRGVLTSGFFGLVDGDAVPSYNYVEPVVPLMNDAHDLGATGFSIRPLQGVLRGSLHWVSLWARNACWVHRPIWRRDESSAVRSVAEVTFGLRTGAWAPLRHRGAVATRRPLRGPGVATNLPARPGTSFLGPGVAGITTHPDGDA